MLLLADTGVAVRRSPQPLLVIVRIFLGIGEENERGPAFLEARGALDAQLSCLGFRIQGLGRPRPTALLPVSRPPCAVRACVYDTPDRRKLIQVNNIYCRKLPTAPPPPGRVPSAPPPPGWVRARVHDTYYFCNLLNAHGAADIPVNLSMPLCGCGCARASARALTHIPPVMSVTVRRLHSHIRTHAYARIHTYIHTHTHAYARIHMQTHTYIQTHTHAYIHTHI